MSDKPFRPMLACETPEDLESLKGFFPMLGSYKLDGIRAIVRSGVLVSRTLKPIPSAFCQEKFAPGLEGLDGELLVPKQHGPTIYHDTYSAVMTHGSKEPVNFWVFDKVSDPLKPYYDRHGDLQEFWGEVEEVRFLEQRQLNSADEILEMETEALAKGFEGLIIRRTDAPYKYGRSTSKEAYLVKVKRFKDAEAYICGFEELMHNENEKTTDALGLSVRSSHKANQVSSGTLGSLRCRFPGKFSEFNIGTGFDAALRQEIWDNQDRYLGMHVKFKFLEYGTKDLPRHPVFLGFRSKEDM